MQTRTLGTNGSFLNTVVLYIFVKTCSESSRNRQKKLKAMYRRLLRSTVHFSRTALRKNKVIVSDMLDQIFDDDYDFSGPDSDRGVG